MMLSDLMEKLACPADHGILSVDVESQEGDDIVAATLTCTVCGQTYPVQDSIPNLLPPELRA